MGNRTFIYLLAVALNITTLYGYTVSLYAKNPLQTATYSSRTSCSSPAPSNTVVQCPTLAYTCLNQLNLLLVAISLLFSGLIFFFLTSRLKETPIETIYRPPISQ